jgi:hypothetical protein
MTPQKSGNAYDGTGMQGGDREDKLAVDRLEYAIRGDGMAGTALEKSMRGSVGREDDEKMMKNSEVPLSSRRNSDHMVDEKAVGELLAQSEADTIRRNSDFNRVPYHHSESKMIDADEDMLSESKKGLSNGVDTRRRTSQKDIAPLSPNTIEIQANVRDSLAYSISPNPNRASPAYHDSDYAEDSFEGLSDVDGEAGRKESSSPVSEKNRATRAVTNEFFLSQVCHKAD